MLPVYKAHSFRRILEKGGRTKPWLVLVNTEAGPSPFVVKLFEPEAIMQRDAVANEVLGNVLARAFQLQVPKAALIDFDEQFMTMLQDPSLMEVLERTDDRLKFGCALLEGVVPFKPGAFSLSEALKIINIDTVFAFDNLIRNPDRKPIKANLLVNSQEGYLIDHEMGFEIDNDTVDRLKQQEWAAKFYQWHLFYPYLKSSSITAKREYFHEFTECLKYLNVNELMPYLRQLQNAGFPTTKHAPVIEYLHYCKENWPNFVILLRMLIA